MSETWLTEPGGVYLPAVVSVGPILHLAGQTARQGSELIAEGVVGLDVDLETARACARQCARNLLAHLAEDVGGYDAVAQVLRLTVYVAADDGFTQHSQVADAASEVFVSELGARGRHVRSAVGVQSLPRRSPVEIDAAVELYRADSSQHATH